MERLKSATNSEDTFINANYAVDYWHDPSFPADATSIAWDPDTYGVDSDTPGSGNYGKDYTWHRPVDYLKAKGEGKEFSLWGPTG